MREVVKRRPLAKLAVKQGVAACLRNAERSRSSWMMPYGSPGESLRLLSALRQDLLVRLGRDPASRIALNFNLTAW